MKKLSKEQLHEQWYKQARDMSMEELPGFVNHLISDYQHDYGTICHALTAAGVATMWAMNMHPQGGITGFQAGYIMWQFIREWNYQGNKTGLRIIDYDNFLYPQYHEKNQKTILPDIWHSIQKTAQENINEADKEYAEYLVKMDQYRIDINAFIKKYPDYHSRKNHYDHLSFGNGKQWEEYEARKVSGFEFAPCEPYCSVTPDSDVYLHWKSITNGIVPFGYVVNLPSRD